MSVQNPLENNTQEEGVFATDGTHVDINTLRTEENHSKDIFRNSDKHKREYTNRAEGEECEAKESDEFKERRHLSSGFSELPISPYASEYTNRDEGEECEAKELDEFKERRKLSSGFSELPISPYASENTTCHKGEESESNESQDFKEERQLSSGFSELPNRIYSRKWSSCTSEQLTRTRQRLSRSLEQLTSTENYCLQPKTRIKTYSLRSLTSRQNERVKTDTWTTISMGQILKALKTRYKRRILFCYRYLKDELFVEEIIDRFIEDGFLNLNDWEDIHAIHVRYKRVDLFLRKLLRSTPEAYEHFLKYLTDCKYGHVRKQLEKTIPKQNTFKIHTADTEKAINYIKNNKEFVVELIDAEAKADYFLQYETFTIDEYEDIISKDTPKRKAECLYDLVMVHGDTAYDILIMVLKEKDLDKYIEDQTEPTDQSSVEEGGNIKIERRRVKEWESKEMSSALKDSREFEIHVKLKGDVKDIKKLENQIKQTLDNIEVRVQMNDRLIKDKQCMVTSVENGSIIITVRRCKKDSFQQLFGTSIQDSILQILRHVFLQPSIREKVRRKALVLEVELHYIPPKKKDMTKDVIDTYFDYLVEELNTFGLTQSLVKKCVLSEKEATKINEPEARKDRMKGLLKVVQKKRAQNIFLEILREERKYVYDHMNRSSHDVIPSNILVESYEELAETMTPSLFIDSVKAYMPLESYSGLSRSLQARYILQHFLETDTNTKIQFVHSLFARDQIPKSLLDNCQQNCLTREAAQKTKTKRKKRSKMIFAADYFIKEEYITIKADVKQVTLTTRPKAIGGTAKYLPGQPSSSIVQKKHVKYIIHGP